MVELRNRKHPTKWKDMSVEFRLMFVHHGCMMVLMIAGGALTLSQEVICALLLATVLTGISVRHRRANRWQWADVGSKDLLKTAGTVVLIVFFLFAATPLFPPSDPRFLPWYLAGFGIGVFSVFNALHLVELSEAEFLLQCRAIDQYGREIARASAIPESTPVEQRWKRIVRTVYGTAFLLVWIAFVAFFYSFGDSFRHGSPVPTSAQTEPLEDHGKTVYVRRDEKTRIDILQTVAFIGIPSMLVSGAILHFALGVKVFEKREGWS